MSHSFVKSPLAAGLSLALGTAALPVPMLAQAQAGGDAIEEVVVRGIRGSLSRSMDLKRDAAGVVDAITAEDIGKFPDSNLAESLQRITGVSIDRRNGEGYQVTVRGFGPEFNQVTLNGRTMPVAQVNETGGLNTGRSFDMSNIAAEGVSGVTVYKSGQADITSGGIGATVDLQTRKPFQNEGLHYSGTIKALHDTTTRVGDDITPELSGFISWSNDQWGISAAGTHQDRTNGRTGGFVNGWSDYTVPYNGASTFDTNNDGIPDSEGPTGTTSDFARTSPVNPVNPPSVGTQVNWPNGLRYTHMDYERQRQNAQVVVQFRPSHAVETTLDWTYARQEFEIERNELSFWFGGGAFPISAVEYTQSDNVTTPLYLLAENEPNNYEPRDVNFGVQGGHVENELQSFGLNVVWDVTDELALRFDWHDSEAKALPGGNGPGNWWNVGIGGQGVSVQGIDNSGDLPLLVGFWDERYERDMDGNVKMDDDGNPIAIDGDEPGEIDKGDLSSTVRQIWHDRTESDLAQTRLDLEWNPSDELGIDFGIESRSMEYTNRSSFDQTPLEGNWGASNPGDIPPDMVEELNFHSLFKGFNTEISPGARDFFDARYGGEMHGPNGTEMTGGELGAFGSTSYISGDSDALGRHLSNNLRKATDCEDPSMAEPQCRGWAPNPVDGTNRLIEEDIFSSYAQVRLAGESGGIPYNMVAGIRYEETEVTSTAQVAPAEIIWQGDNDFTAPSGSATDVAPVVQDATYDHWLPSFSISLDVLDDLVARASWSTTIARADFASLQQGLSGIGGPRGGPTLLGGLNGTATNGNVGLLPMKSENVDLSLEWYYGDSSYVAVSWFHKDVPNFIGNMEVETEANTENGAAGPTRDPSNGPRAQAARAELQKRGLEVNQQNLFRMVASLDDGRGGCVNNPAVTVKLCGAGYNETTYEDPSGGTGWETGVDIVALPEDPLSVLDAQTPVNASDAELTGWELAIQHFFGESGFGFQANYTEVDGSLEYDVAATGNAVQFALTGLSDSANVVLIFEKYGWQARLAWNWRDDFLNSANVGGNEPEYTEAYDQWDFSVGYDIRDNWSVTLEGINITDNHIRRYGRSQAQFRNLEILGARYTLSTRYVF